MRERRDAREAGRIVRQHPAVYVVELNEARPLQVLADEDGKASSSAAAEREVCEGCAAAVERGVSAQGLIKIR